LLLYTLYFFLLHFALELFFSYNSRRLNFIFFKNMKILEKRKWSSFLLVSSKALRCRKRYKKIVTKSGVPPAGLIFLILIFFNIFLFFIFHFVFFSFLIFHFFFPFIFYFVFFFISFIFSIFFRFSFCFRFYFYFVNFHLLHFALLIPFSF